MRTWLGLAERRAGGDEDAGAGQARGELAAVDRGMGGPDEVGLAVGHVEAALAQRGGHDAGARSQIAAHAPVERAPSSVRSASSAPAWETSETPRSGSSSASSSSEPGPPIA